jgi:hypothetical protein
MTVTVLTAIPRFDAPVYQENNISRQTIRRNQILRKFISRKNRTLKLLWMAVKIRLQV